MARGWGSKSIEQQMEDAQTAPKQDAALAPADVELKRKREGLLLQRSRVLQEMDASRNPRYRELLKEMLRHLESQLSSCKN